jgi:RNA polymerase sigma-70 factor (sigma-E family)
MTERSGSFEDLVRQERSGLLRRAFLLCGDWQEAEDLTQDTLVKLYRRWPYLHRRDELAGYVHTILVRTYLNERRRPHRRREHLSPDPPDLPDTRDHNQVTDTRLALLAALRALNRTQRAVLVLRFVEDLSVSDVATLMGMTPGTVTSHTHRALATLRVKLGHQPL